MGVNSGLHFTGGEPFLNFPLLLKGVTLAEKEGIPSIFVETNAFWAREDEDTYRKLMLLKEAGLKGILVSVNPFVVEHVPFERIERVVRVGYEVFGGNLFIYQIEYYRMFRNWKLKGRLSLKEFFERGGRLKGELLLMGRAVYRMEGFLSPSFFSFERICFPELFRSWHNHWDNYGNVVPGFCAGISLGNWKENPEIYEKGVDLDKLPLVKILAEEGVKGLLVWAKKLFDYRERKSYLSPCHLCLDIRNFLVERGEILSELSPLQYYQVLREEIFSTPHR